MARNRGQIVGKMVYCRDKRMEDSRVYALDGTAWIIGPFVTAYMDWSEFCDTTRANREWTMTYSISAQIFAQSVAEGS